MYEVSINVVFMTGLVWGILMGVAITFAFMVTQGMKKKQSFPEEKMTIQEDDKLAELAQRSNADLDRIRYSGKDYYGVFALSEMFLVAG